MSIVFTIVIFGAERILLLSTLNLLIAISSAQRKDQRSKIEDLLIHDITQERYIKPKAAAED